MVTALAVVVEPEDKRITVQSVERVAQTKAAVVAVAVMEVPIMQEPQRQQALELLDRQKLQPAPVGQAEQRPSAAQEVAAAVEVVVLVGVWDRQGQFQQFRQFVE